MRPPQPPHTRPVATSTPGRPAPQPAAPLDPAEVERRQAAAAAAEEAEYQESRKKLVVVTAGALVLADVIGQGLPKKGAAAYETRTARMEMAFDFAEDFLAEAEKRVGKLPLME